MAQVVNEFQNFDISNTHFEALQFISFPSSLLSASCQFGLSAFEERCTSGASFADSIIPKPSLDMLLSRFRQSLATVSFLNTSCLLSCNHGTFAIFDAIRLNSETDSRDEVHTEESGIRRDKSSYPGPKMRSSFLDLLGVK